MSKKALSVTLDDDNVLWLRGQATMRSVSEVLDNLVTDARRNGKVRSDGIRSVKGTVSLPDDDPDLVKADEYIRAWFEQSLNRPLVVREPRAKYGSRKHRARKTRPFAKRGSRG